MVWFRVRGLGTLLIDPIKSVQERIDDLMCCVDVNSAYSLDGKTESLECCVDKFDQMAPGVFWVAITIVHALVYALQSHTCLNHDA